jgi:SulP family sulfate permease
MVAFGMGEWHYFTHLRRAPKSDYLVFIATFSLTVIFDLVAGIMVGMILAEFLFMKKRMADVASVELIADNDEGKDDRLFDAASLFPDAASAVYRIRGPFFFGAAEKFLGTLRKLDPDVLRVVLDMSGVPAMDATAFRALEMMAEQMEKLGGSLLLSGLNPQPRAFLQRYGFLERDGIEILPETGQ